MYDNDELTVAKVEMDEQDDTLTVQVTTADRIARVVVVINGNEIGTWDADQGVEA